MRIDKYLWCVRLQKTRSKATKFIEAGNLMINGEETKKASREIRVDQTFSIRVQPKLQNRGYLWVLNKIRQKPGLQSNPTRSTQPTYRGS